MKIVHNMKLTSLILALTLLSSNGVLADCPCSSQDIEDIQTMQQDNNNSQDQDEQDINNTDPDQ